MLSYPMICRFSIGVEVQEIKNCYLSFKGCFFRLSPYSVMGDSRSRNRFS